MEPTGMRTTDFLSDASFWYPDRLAADRAWIEHIPFAFWLIGASKPRNLVELGTYSGNSFFAFCQAAKAHQTETRLTAVDTWQGDQHVGRYDDSIYHDVLDYRDRTYPKHAALMRTTFDQARHEFGPGSIDILHIDGLHTYQAVKHDFDFWLGTLSDRGIVLFHDIAVHKGDFGVWKLWEEDLTAYPKFGFSHCNGLGVLGIGNDIPAPVKTLFDLADDPDKAGYVRNIYARLGQSIVNWQEIANAANKKLNDIETSRSWKIANSIAKLARRPG